jgi:hypothetical protein
MNHQPNLIKLAITAAGGRERVAQHFGLTTWGVGNWIRSHRMPASNIRPLCDLGQNIIKPEQVLAYIERMATAEKEAA